MQRIKNGARRVWSGLKRCWKYLWPRIKSAGKASIKRGRRVPWKTAVFLGTAIFCLFYLFGGLGETPISLWWIGIGIVCLVLAVLLLNWAVGTAFNRDGEGAKLKKDPEKPDPTEVKAPPPPAPAHNHGESHGSSGGHGGGHHGPSLLDRVLSLGFIALMAFAAYWLYQHLHSLEGKQLVRHPVQVMTAGSNSVPVGMTSPTLNLAQHDYCQAPKGEVTIHQPSMLWTVISIPQGGPGYELCMDTLPDGKGVFAECSTSKDGEDWGICGRWSKRARVRATEQPLKTWFEPHVVQ